MRSSLKLILALSLSAPLLAQTATTAEGNSPAPPAGAPQHHGGIGIGAHAGGGSLPATIANAPVTAQFTSTAQMTGRNGEQHTMSSTRLVYRDAMGRVREDETFTPSGTASPTDNPIGGNRAHMRGNRNMTIILDPVAGTVTSLDVDRKAAVVETVPAQFFQHEQKREERESNGQPGGRNAQVTELGSKTIAGVVAKGEKVTRTIPAHDASETAQTVTREVWFSPDLKLEVSSTEMGAHGTRTETATSISKAEPDALLFKVPEGYTVTQAAPHNGMRHGSHMPKSVNGEQDAPPAAM